MVERGRCASFQLEPNEPLGVVGEVGRQDLDGDVAAQPRIVSAVHLAHAARADQTENLVGADA